MTQFNTIFDECAKKSGLSWDFIFGDRDSNTIVNRNREEFPNIQRSFSEPLKPIFDQLGRVSREINLYILNLEFFDTNNNIISEDVGAGLDDIMLKFISFRNLMRRKGIEIELTRTPYPLWQQFDCNEYGYVFDFNAIYSLNLCQ